MYDVKRAYSLLERISFERMGGTENELKAANILKDEIDFIKNIYYNYTSKKLISQVKRIKWRF